VTEAGREAWKALRQLMERGMPLKLMHLRPTSRMSSAVWMGSLGLGLWWPGEDATSWRMVRESGELRVNVAAACFPPPSC
jgi:hypothetical protein